MAQKLGEAYVLVSADLSRLNKDLTAAANHVNLAALRMRMSIEKNLGSKTLSKGVLSGVTIGLAAFGAAALATHPAVEALGEALLNLGHAIIDATIGPAIEKAADAINEFTEAARKVGFLEAFKTVFSPETQYTILGIAGAIMGAMVPALWAKVTALWATASASIAAAGGLGALAASVWAAMAPFLAWIAIGAAVVMAAWWLYNNWDQVVNALAAAWEWIKEKANNIWQSIKDFFVSWGKKIVAFFKEHWDELLIIVFNVAGLIVVTVIRHWDEIKAFTSKIWNAIKSFFKSVWEGIKSVFGPPLKWLWDQIVKIWNNIKSNTSSVWNGIKSSLSSAWNSIKSAFSKAWNSLKSVASNVWSSIKSTVRSNVNSVIGFVNKMIDAINRAISGINKIAGTSFSKIPRIPGLASGGIVTSPTLAVVGEGRHPEAVIPLSERTFRMLAEGIVSELGGIGGGVVVQQMIVRNDQDIHRIAEELYRLQRRKMRSGL